MENKKYPCESVFVHQPEEISEVFTELWCQLINEKESGKHSELSFSDHNNIGGGNAHED